MTQDARELDPDHRGDGRQATLDIPAGAFVCIVGDSCSGLRVVLMVMLRAGTQLAAADGSVVVTFPAV